MVESLATIMSHFSGEANRARCLAHIVNLVAKIILGQFDKSKKKKKGKNLPDVVNDNDNEIVVDKDKVVVEENVEDSDDDEQMERVMDKEEKEMDEGGGDDEDDEDGEKLLQDAEILEELMEDDIERVGMKAKPVRQALFKVNTTFFSFLFFFRSIPSRSFPSLLFFNLPSFFYNLSSNPWLSIPALSFFLYFYFRFLREPSFRSKTVTLSFYICLPLLFTVAIAFFIYRCHRIISSHFFSPFFSHYSLLFLRLPLPSPLCFHRSHRFSIPSPLLFLPPCSLCFYRCHRFSIPSPFFSFHRVLFVSTVAIGFRSPRPSFSSAMFFFFRSKSLCFFYIIYISTPFSQPTTILFPHLFFTPILFTPLYVSLFMLLSPFFISLPLLYFFYRCSLLFYRCSILFL